jgi:hypothetical protein
LTQDPPAQAKFARAARTHFLRGGSVAVVVNDESRTFGIKSLANRLPKIKLH